MTSGTDNTRDSALFAERANEGADRSRPSLETTKGEAEKERSAPAGGKESLSKFLAQEVVESRGMIYLYRAATLMCVLNGVAVIVKAAA